MQIARKGKRKEKKGLAIVINSSQQQPTNTTEDNIGNTKRFSKSNASKKEKNAQAPSSFDPRS
jgi:hypothetical protein